MTSIETRLFINGEFVNGTGGSFSLINPATEKLVCEKIHVASLQDVDRAVRCAEAAQPAWAELPASVRAACLIKLATLIEKNASKIAELDAISMGRPVGVQGLDLYASVSRLHFDAGLAQSVVGESSLLNPGQLNLVLRQPFGVTAAIDKSLSNLWSIISSANFFSWRRLLPWNVPLLLWVTKVSASVAAGNSMLLKSSEKSPLAALFLAGLTVEAGFPPGIVQVISGKGDTGKLLSEHMGIRKISFTGSSRTGKLIAAAAAMSNLKAVSLELGGKSPTIIFEDADLAQAVPACAFSIQWNSGQICIANSRLYVHEKIAEKFIEQFKIAFGTYKHGDPLDKETTLGPQADDIQGKTVLRYIEIGKKDGQLVMGGERVGTKGYFVTPTIFTGIPEDSVINKEEVFGPVVIIHTFSDEADVIRRANDTEYGLYAAVFTKDIDRAIRVAKKLESGHVAINASSPTTANELPFGGYKASGQGREAGLASLLRWTEEKSVVIKFA